MILVRTHQLLLVAQGCGGAHLPGEQADVPLRIGVPLRGVGQGPSLIA